MTSNTIRIKLTDATNGTWTIADDPTTVVATDVTIPPDNDYYTLGMALQPYALSWCRWTNISSDVVYVQCINPAEAGNFLYGCVAEPVVCTLRIEGQHIDILT